MAKHKHKKKSGERIVYAESMAYVLEHPPAFKVDRNYEKEKTRIEEKLTRPAREEGAWKQMWMQVQSNRFIVDADTRIIHDRSCQIGQALPREQFSMIEDFDPSLKPCKACRTKAVIRQLTQWPEDYKDVLNLLESCEIEFGDLMLLLRKNVKIRYVTYNVLELRNGEEHWRLEKLNRDRFELYHNSYILEESRRRFTGKYHPQKVKGKHNFHNTIMEVIRYNSDYHIKKILELHDQMLDEALEQAPDNILLFPTPATVLFSLPTIYRIRGKGILFDYYMYVYCKENYADTVFKKRKIFQKKLYERPGITTGYKLVFCKIFKFQHSRVFSAINEVKKLMYKKHYRDGHIVMEVANQYFTARGVKTAALKAPGKK